MPKKKTTRLPLPKSPTEKYPFRVNVPEDVSLSAFKKKYPRIKYIVIRRPYQDKLAVRFATALGESTFHKWVSRTRRRKHTTQATEQAAPAPMMRRKEDKLLGTDIAITMSKADWEEISCALADQICWNKGFEAARPDSNNGPIATGRLQEFNRRIKSVIHA